VDNSAHEYKAMIDSGTMTAVAKASLVPESCREYVGKTYLQGAFGECVDADLVILKVRLKPDTFNCTNAINTEPTTQLTLISKFNVKSSNV